MGIQAALFDLDETLVPDEETTAAALVAACGPLETQFGVDATVLAAAVRARAREVWQTGPAIEYCRRIGIASWEGLWGDCRGEDPSLEVLSAWLPGYREEAWRRALADQGVRDERLVRSLVLGYPEVRRNLGNVYEDAAPVLAALKTEYRLALVTNGAPALQRGKLLASGLAEYFGTVVVSGEIGAGKPDGRIFEHALSLLGVKAWEAAMVGDSLVNDVAGARDRGLFAVWLNRAGLALPAGITPDREINALHELVAVLD